MIIHKRKEVLVRLIEIAMTKCDKEINIRICRFLSEKTNRGLHSASHIVILEICKLLEGVLADDKGLLVNAERKCGAKSFKFNRQINFREKEFDKLIEEIKKKL